MVLFPGDPFFTEDDARKFINPIEDRLRTCVVDGFADHVRACQLIEAFGPSLDYLGGRAKVINSLVVEHVRREFAEPSDEISTTDENGFLELQLRRARETYGVDVRFKMVDKAGRIQATDTDAQWNYQNQLPLIGPGDAGRFARVTLGWRWDAAATALEDVCVVYAKGNDPVWLYSILNTEEPPQAMPILAPNNQPDLAGGGARFVSQTKKAKKGKDAQGSA